MNIEKLLLAESDFLVRFPNGFDHPDMIEVGKKHKVDKMITQTQTLFSKIGFANPANVLESWTKTVSQSSMVSVFEKPAFKRFINSLSPKDQIHIVEGLYEQLHGKQEKGFNAVAEILARHKMAKWTIISAIPIYFRPTKEVFMKPTTVKGVIKLFELEGLIYSPKPNWDLYKNFRAELMTMKKIVDKNLSPNNAAFTGFLMMSLNK